MKRGALLGLCLLAGSLVSLGAAEIAVKPLSGAVKVDGKLTEKTWQRSPDVTAFIPYRPLREGRVQPKTRAWLTFDARNLYAGIWCEEPVMSKIKTKAKKNDEPAWQDDSIELFLVPAADRETYVQIVFNTAAVIFDQLQAHDGVSKSNLDWNADAVCAVFKGKDFWSAEIAIPFANLPVAAPRGDWKINVVRNRIGMGEYYSCLEGASSFHDLDKFPRVSGITIPDLTLTVDEIVFPDVRCGKNTAKVTVRNWSNAPADARLTVKDPGSGKVLAAAEKKAAPGAGTALACSWQVPFDAKECRLELAVTCGKRVLRKSIFKNILPELLPDERQAVRILTPNRPVEIRQLLSVSPQTLPETTLAWQVRDEKGSLMTEGVTTPKDGAALLRIFWSFMEEGRYTLKLQLLHRGKAVSSVTRALRILNSPFQGF